MQALLQEALLPVNIVFTILLITVILYWLTVILGLIDISAFDLDIDTPDVDADTDVHSHGGGGWFSNSLQFFNFGRIPFMVVFSFLALSMWTFSILINYYLGHGSWSTALILFLPNLAVSLLITKLVTTPLIPLFRHLDGSEEPVDYVGLECTLVLPASAVAMGQAEVMINNTPLLINVKPAAEQSLEKGIKALIINEAPDGKYYLIKKFEP